MRKLLCVQNSPAVCKSLAGNFKKYDVELTACQCPWDALKLGTRNYFNLAIIDIIEPGMKDIPDGAELFYLFKNYRVYIPHTILIVGDDISRYEHLIFEGVTQVIQRPVAIPLVVSLAMEILDYDELTPAGGLVA